MTIILHKDGLVSYYGKILAYQEANQYLDSFRIKHQKYNQHLWYPEDGASGL
jgi:hypothetical protein